MRSQCWFLYCASGTVVLLLSLTVLGASEVSANLYCNSRTSVLGRLRDYLRLLMKRSVCNGRIVLELDC